MAGDGQDLLGAPATAMDKGSIDVLGVLAATSLTISSRPFAFHHRQLAGQPVEMLTRGAQVTGVASCALCLTWISCAARFYVRIRLQKFFGIEDWLTVAALILLTILCGLLLGVVNYGLGAHIYALSDAMLSTAAQYIFVCELLYVVTMAVTKASIGAFFLRLSGQRYQKIIIHSVMAVVMLYSTMYFLFLLLQCRPVNFLWGQFSKDSSGSCISHQTLADVTYAHAAVSAVTDWALGILPVTFVWGMKMNPRTKLSVVFILCLGFFASTATIVRIVYIHSLTLTTDYTWEGINLAKWSLVEPAIGITAAAIATLRPLFKNFLLAPYFKSNKHTRSVELQSRDSSESDMMVRPGSGKQAAYSREFAMMMGLRDVGVTTTITAGGEKHAGSVWKRKSKGEKRQSAGLWASQHVDHNASQTELKAVRTMEEGEAQRLPNESRGGNEWMGITKTTVITTEQ